MSAERAIACAERLLVALDFDGTLSPIVPRPDMARALPGAAAALSRLAALPGVHLAVVSGRDVDDLRRLLADLPPVWMAGSHGRVLVSPGDDIPEVSHDPRLDTFLTRTCPSGVRREPKSFSVAFHWRGRKEGEPTGWLRDLERDALAGGLDVMGGRRVFEILLPGAGKEHALERLRASTGATAVVYAGDDRTDLEAILQAQSCGLGIFVRSGERSWNPPANVLVLDGPDDLARWLERLAGLREAAF